MADDSSAEFLKRGRRRARNRFLLLAVLLVFTVGGVAWRAVGLVQRMSEPTVEELRLFVEPDSTAQWEGKTYGKDEFDRLLGDIATGHPGAHVIVCAPDVRNPLAAMVTLRSVQYGLKAGLVRGFDARCRR